MRSNALVLAITSCLLLAACKGDGDDDGEWSPDREGDAPAGGDAFDGMIDGKAVSCRCTDGDCTVVYDGRTIMSGAKVVIDDILIASDGRCHPIP